MTSPKTAPHRTPRILFILGFGFISVTPSAFIQVYIFPYRLGFIKKDFGEIRIEIF
jgi:hypothetical protein